MSGPDTAYGSKLTEIYKRQYDIKEEPCDYDQEFLIKEDSQARKIQETISSLGQFIDQDLKDIKKLRMYLYKIKEDLRKRRKEINAAEKYPPKVKNEQETPQQQYVSDDLNFFVNRR